MQPKLISIICPVYNAEKYLRNCVDSVLRQSYPYWELWLINDGSSDRSQRIIDQLTGEDERIYRIHLGQNEGVAAARNAGLNQARGVYIAFLDSDDAWHPQKLEKQLSFMLAQQADLSHTAYEKVNAGGKIIRAHVPVGIRAGYRELLRHNEIGLSTAMVKTSVLGGLRFMKVGHEDYVFWLKLVKLVKESKGLNEVLTTYRSHSGSLSHNKLVAAGYTWNIYRKIEKLSIFKAGYYFMCYCWNAGKKYIKRK